MKKLIPMLFVVMILATGCPQPEPEVQQVEIGLFTPYAVFPEMLNGKVKDLVEKSYLGVESEGTILKGDRLTVAARDTIEWTNDFRLSYDENGNLLLCEQIDENDAIISWDRQTLEEGRIVRSEYGSNDTLRRYSLLTYNEAGNIVKLEMYRLPVDTLTSTGLLLSDDQGNFLEWQRLDWKGDSTAKYVFTVNQEGQRTSYAFYNNEGQKTQEQRFTYNEMGTLSKQVIIDSEGVEYTSEYEYEYDEMNNWIKATCKSSDGYTIIEERTITYYE